MGKQIGSQKLAYELIYQSHPNGLDAKSFMFEKIQPGSKLWTDGASIYKHAEQHWSVEHASDLHAKFEFEHTSETEGVFGMLRTLIHLLGRKGIHI